LLLSQGATLTDQYPGRFREAFVILKQEAQPGDILLLQDGALFAAAEYYGSPIPYAGIPQDKLTNVNHQAQIDEALDALKTILTPGTRHIWVLSWQGDIMDPTGLAFALPEYLSDGQRRVWLSPAQSEASNDLRLVEYVLSEQKLPLPEHIVAYPGILQVLPDGPSLLGYDVFFSFHESSDEDRDCSVIVHTWWWRGEIDYPATKMSVSLFGPGDRRLAQHDQPPAGYTFGQEKWTPFVPTLGRVELTFPCSQFEADRTYDVWLAVYDSNGEKPEQRVLLETFAGKSLP
jgi:hypothetical protein